MDKNQHAFFELLRGGLWEKDVWLSTYDSIDYSEIQRLAEEQSVVGLVAAGLEHVEDVKLPKEDLLQFIGQTLQLEQRNKAMNNFVAGLVEKLRNEDVYSLLLKGQGIAQCYERPLWRACGDVDLFLSEDNYKKAKAVLAPLASSIEEENNYTKHFGMTINSWEVELHGNLRSELYKKIDRELDKVKDDVFFGGNVRSWANGSTQVFLPSANNDVVYVFTHILQHFFKGGIGLRQICDWCRLLWTYKDSIKQDLLEKRIRKMGLMSEWRAFAALAVDNLGMPAEAIPLYSNSNKWSKKGKRILGFVFETGSFGHNRDMSFHQETNVFSRKLKMLRHITSDTFKQLVIFPLDSMIVWWNTMLVGIRSMAGN